MQITTVKKRILRNAFNLINQQRTLKVKSWVLSRMIRKTNEKVDLRLRYQSFLTAKHKNMMFKVFYGMYNVYYHSMSKLSFF